MNFFTSKPDPPPPPDKISFFQLVVYIWIFCVFIKYLDEKSGGKILEKRIRKKKKKKDDPLKNVVGLESVKEEIRYYMDFIKNKAKYAYL